MAYRNGTYIAFDGLGQVNPTYSDFRYYGLIEAWAKNKNIHFKYINSHDKTCAVRDSSLRSTLEARIRERLSKSKNMVVILSSDTRKTGSMLSYEIEKAVDYYKIPLIIAYVDYKIVAEPSQLFNYWPNSLSARIGNGTVKAIHVPFIRDAIIDAISQFSVSKLPKSSLSYYNKEAHRNFDILNSTGMFRNTWK
ncbi:TIR domain-containing protein [Methanolobus psychrotolerans]|uniref:TIR domain-containing protein n=1 Tax=Methanolobus psychrotolerans TaxID=1874706 RepID=UPI000B915FCF|nr:TIR domain-containing protein [Methanolobus psychrotolerans]